MRADLQRLVPLLGAHEDEKPQLQRLFEVLLLFRQGVQFTQRIPEHFQFDIPLCGKKRTFQRHMQGNKVNSPSLATRNARRRPP